MKKLANILMTFIKVGLTTVLIVMLPLVVFTFVASKSPIFWGIRSFVVVTGSMMPTIPVGSLAFVMPQKIYSSGDVVSFKRGDEIVTHRIVQQLSQTGAIAYQTKGDANKYLDDQIVEQKDVIGKGVFQVLYVGNILFFLKTPLGFISCIFIPSFLYIILEIATIQRITAKQTEQRLRRQFSQQPWSASL